MLPFLISSYIANINSLAPVRSGFNLKSAIFNLVLLIGIFTSSYDNTLRWMSWDLAEDRSTSVQAMAWCRQATSHYLSQYWPRYVSPYGITRAQWVKEINHGGFTADFHDDVFSHFKSWEIGADCRKNNSWNTCSTWVKWSMIMKSFFLSLLLSNTPK